MSRKTIFGALAVAAGVTAAVAVKLYNDAKHKTKEEEEDEEVHFIEIDSDDKEQETNESALEGKSDEVREICTVYPYLTPDFVEEIISVKEQEFRTMKTEEDLVSVVHSVSFETDSELEQFIAIMDEAGFTVETEEHDVKVSRKFFAKQGAIASDILNVANQTAALNGTYSGFEVE